MDKLTTEHLKKLRDELQPHVNTYSSQTTDWLWQLINVLSNDGLLEEEQQIPLVRVADAITQNKDKFNVYIPRLSRTSFLVSDVSFSVADKTVTLICEPK